MSNASALPSGTLRRLQRLIVTRPAPEAQAWVDALRGDGWPAQALPLIDITPPTAPDDQAALHHWRAHWALADAILFVSGAAVSRFFDGAAAPAAGPTRTRFWAPGPGTARLLAEALQPLGMEVACIDTPPADAAQFDSEHLWPVVSSQVGPGRRVLIVRGKSAVWSTSDAPPDATDVAGSGRDWLIRQCLAAGAQVQGCVAYERRVPQLSAADRALVGSAAGDGSVWLFSSSEALSPLRSLHPAPSWAQASALVTHPRIADATAQAGFGHIVQSRPALADVMRALESGWTRP